MQNQIVPYCYTADRLLETQLSLDKIVNTIVDYPYSILSLQLTPILLSDEEKTTVEQMGQVLNSLSQGIMEWVILVFLLHKNQQKIINIMPN